MKTIILSAEHELRATGALSDATCRAFAQADEATKRGFEASFAFLGCPTSAATSHGEAVLPERRVEAIRLMMLRVGAHTDDPRWSSHVLDQLFDAALQPSGATIGEVVHALFVVLAECPPGLSNTQVNFIREVGKYVVGRKRHAWAAEDFSWLAAAVADPTTKIGAAQAYLAAYTLPVSFIPRCKDSILRALHSTQFEEEVQQLLED